MKRDYPDRPIVGVGAVIVDAGRVVVVRREREPLKGEWSIPGGVVELGETLREGTAREALEETGLTIEVGEVLEVFDRIIRDPEGGTRFHYVLVDFLCRRTAGELRSGSDAAEARWVSAGELERFVLSDGAEQVIRKAFRAAAGA
jgi:8-oxo-dGTP diphosphatase